jgi:hypothetical protein
MDEIMLNFSEFDRQDSHAVPDEPMFTLQRRGLISLNLAAYKALGEPVSVALMYEADEGIIALRKVTRTYHNGYPVRKQANSRSFLVGATGFTSYHRIETEMPRRFVGHVYADQLVGFKLAEGVIVKTRTRTPKASVHELHQADHARRSVDGQR